MPITAASLVNKTLIILNDDGTAWTKSELLGWLNDGQRVIVTVRPDAGAVHQTFQLAAGTLQSIPAGTLRVLKLLRNMGAAGATPGTVIREIAADILDRQVPDWHTGATVPAAAVVDRCVYNGEDPTHFWVYPPQPAVAMGFIEGLFSAPPTDCTMNTVDGSNVDSNLGIPDNYGPALIDYVLFRAYSKETDTRNPAKGEAALSAFQTALGMTIQTDKAFDPKSNASPPNSFGNG